MKKKKSVSNVSKKNSPVHLKKTFIKIAKPQRDYSSFFIALFSLGVIAFVVFMAAISDGKFGSNNDETMTSGTQSATIVITDNGEIDEDTTVKQGDGSVYAPERVKYKISSFNKLALQPLEFEVFDEKANAYTPDNLKEINKSKMHLFVTSANLKEYLHLYPYFENGKWKVLANIPIPGTYYTYIDIVPAEGEPEVIRSELTVQEAKKDNLDYPLVNPEMAAQDRSLSVKLQLDKPNLLQQTVLSYQIMRDNAPFQLLQNYWGVLGDTVIIGHNDPDNYVRIFPISTSGVDQGKVEFVTAFAKSGLYTAFAQFRAYDRTYTFPITFEIK